jgi:hypothetical protein
LLNLALVHGQQHSRHQRVGSGAGFVGRGHGGSEQVTR